MPKWSDLLFGMTIAVIAYTGIEAAANLAPEVRVSAEALRAHRRRGRGGGAARVRRDVDGRADGAAGRAGRAESSAARTRGYGTELGGQYVEAPVLGVVEALTVELGGRRARATRSRSSRRSC